MIRYRKFSVSTVLTKSTIITENVRSFFEINLSFRKQTRPDTTSFFYDKKNKKIFSKAAEGIQSSPLEESVIIISKGLSSIFRKENHPSPRCDRQPHHFEERVIHHLEEKAHPSFRSDMRNHFETTVSSPINQS